VALVNWHPPDSQGPRGSIAPTAFAALYSTELSLGESTIHPLIELSERKARLRVDAAVLRRNAWLHAGLSASQALIDFGSPLAEILRARSGTAVGGYYPVRDELDPRGLIEFFHRKHFRIGLPKTAPGPMLTFRQWVPGTPLMRGKFRIQEPGDGQPEIIPDLVLVPLLAFDRMGNRLGYGAGFYDVALRALRRNGSIIAAGLGFDEQELTEIPREPQDEPLDMIVTPSRIIACGD
jgi:5-formyltetrahydrofolate cyclo-ligase